MKNCIASAEMALAALASGDLKHWHLAVLLTVWWAVAALQLISPLFCRRRNRYWQNCSPLPDRRVYGRHPVAASGRQPDAHFAGLLAAVLIGIPVGIAMGLSPTCAAFWIR